MSCSLFGFCRHVAQVRRDEVPGQSASRPSLHGRSDGCRVQGPALRLRDERSSAVRESECGEQELVREDQDAHHHVHGGHGELDVSRGDPGLDDCAVDHQQLGAVDCLAQGRGREDAFLPLLLEFGLRYGGSHRYRSDRTLDESAFEVARRPAVNEYEEVQGAVRPRRGDCAGRDGIPRLRRCRSATGEARIRPSLRGR